MAFVDQLDGSELTLGEDGFDGHFFNVNMAVGPAAANRWDDVMLVQYLLKRIYENVWSFRPPLHRPPGSMNIDGRFGSTTAKWINHFQREVADRGGVPIRVDGRVDKSDSGGFSSLSRTLYTIVALNKGLQTVDPEAFQDPSLDGECPPDLLRRLGHLVVEVSGPVAG